MKKTSSPSPFHEVAKRWRLLFAPGVSVQSLSGSWRQVVKVRPDHHVEWRRIGVSRSPTSGVSSPRSWVEWVFSPREERS